MIQISSFRIVSPLDLVPSTFHTLKLPLRLPDTKSVLPWRKVSEVIANCIVSVTEESSDFGRQENVRVQDQIRSELGRKTESRQFGVMSWCSE